ncbi:MAG: hypothetical protein ACRDY1_01260 [Acidimicrobiales bacterium]
MTATESGAGTTTPRQFPVHHHRGATNGPAGTVITVTGTVSLTS